MFNDALGQCLSCLHYETPLGRIIGGKRRSMGTMASLVAQLVKNLPEMQEIPVRFLDQEDPLEKGSPTHSGIPGLPL